MAGPGGGDRAEQRRDPRAAGQAGDERLVLGDLLRGSERGHGTLLVARGRAGAGHGGGYRPADRGGDGLGVGLVGVTQRGQTLGEGGYRGDDGGVKVTERNGVRQ